MQEKGSISIHTENIFPIIKKFLYSDHEIFLRELVSNAADATQKIKQLSSLGEFKGELGDLTIEVAYDKKKKTITVSDKGVGMTTEEIKKYINQIAFSGATEFLEKYKEKGEDQQIIGHFGLGFYSAFMVANQVEIITLSHKENAEAAKWTCTGDTEFLIERTKKKQRGTDIILHISEDSEEFLEEQRLQNILNKYSKFLPIPIKFGQKDESIEDGKDKEDKTKYKTIKVDNIINETQPLWTKSPNQLKDEDYLEFYRSLYPMSENPLFWIHLNVDYPFNLTGILYFPKLKKDFNLQKNKIQLYSKQVFITDEVKDIVPEFLQLLHGVIDSPDIPLNVSRSYLQSDTNVKKINKYISKKVADKLEQLFKNERENYEKKWEDIGMFIKYGMISEEKFAEKANKIVLLKNVNNKYFTIEEYKKHIENTQTNKDKNVIFLYTNDKEKQHGYINNAQKRGYDVIELGSPIDSHFINHLEQKNEKIQMQRVDADVIDKLIDKDEKKEFIISDKEKEALKELFETVVADKKNTINIEAMAPDDMPVTITLPEFMRRMKDMQSVGGGTMMFGDFPITLSITVNANHAFVKKILEINKKEEKEKLAKQVYDLALLAQGMLEGKNLTDFLNRSVEMSLN